MVSDEKNMEVANEALSPHRKSQKTSKDKKRKKIKKEKKKNKNKRKHSTSESNSSNGSDNEVWVEKTINSLELVQNSTSNAITKEPLKRDEWMTLGNLFPCTSRSDMRSNKSDKQKKDNDNAILDKPGQNSRELNPYWKDGGTGLPQNELEQTSNEKIMDPVWLTKSLQRAKEQAREEGRSLEEIAAERWGSLEMIYTMIAKAEQLYYKQNQKYLHQNQSNYGKHYNDRYSDRHREQRQDYSRYKSRSQDRDKRHESYRKSKQIYQKPTDDIDYNTPVAGKSNSSRIRNWQNVNVNSNSKRQLEPHIPATFDEISMKNNKILSETNVKSNETLSKEDMNKLGAKIIKAELMGDNELAERLKKQLEQARELCSQIEKGTTENVILSRTDSKGITRPLQPRCLSQESSNKSKKKNNVDTHISGERVRYFGDDDKYSLQQLFQREKGRSVDDDDAAFVKMASKNMDMNDIFEEQIARADTDSKLDNRDKTNAIKQHKKISKSLEECSWCLESKNMVKHMIVAMDTHICLSLPTRVSLVPGHCILTPVQHIACQLQLDEDIWEKIKVFKETLIKMFMDNKQTLIFFEIYKNRHRFPHMQLECVPLPDERADLAPMYFKKALLECETEWAINKKIVNLQNKELRRAIPNGLPYFVVQFGNNSGYAHVIEDERLFPTNFAEEIIGGILNLDHNLWRKPKKDSFEQQKEKVLEFTKVWDKYKHLLDNDCK